MFVLVYTYFVLLLYSHEQLYIHICIQNHNNAIKTSGHSSLEKNIPLTLMKGLCMRGSLRPNKDCNIVTPTLLATGAFLSRSPELLNRGPGGPASLGTLVLIPASSLQLTDFLSSPGLYNCSTITFFLWASQIALNSTRPRSRLYPDIPRPDAPIIYTGTFLILTAWPGRRSICNIAISYYPCPLLLGMVLPVRVQYMVQIDLFRTYLYCSVGISMGGEQRQCVTRSVRHMSEGVKVNMKKQRKHFISFQAFNYEHLGL